MVGASKAVKLYDFINIKLARMMWDKRKAGNSRDT